MSESITEKLSRFTPDAGGLDRDALLFAAGRASARPNRPWVALAGVLAAAQVLSLVLLWPRTPALTGVPEIVNTAPPAKAQPSPREEVTPPAPSPLSLWALQQQLLEHGDAPAPAAPVEDMAPGAPPLRAFPISADAFPN